LKTLPYFCACPKPGPGYPTSYVMVFLMFIELRWEVIVCFVDIVGIVDLHCFYYSKKFNIIITKYILFCFCWYNKLSKSDFNWLQDIIFLNSVRIPSFTVCMWKIIRLESPELKSVKVVALCLGFYWTFHIEERHR
jgi:hypothetical protein